MTSYDRFDRDLAVWLDAETAVSAPAGLHAGAIEQARHARQRPGWLVAIRGGTIGRAAAPALDRRAVYVLAVLGLLLAVVLAALVAGALRNDRHRLGANGSITYTYQGNNHGPGGTWQVGPEGTGASQIKGSGGCPRFSRDGGVMVTATGDSALTTLLVTDTTTGRVTSSVLAQFLDYAWHPHFGSYDLSPDGTRIAWLKSADATWDQPGREIWVSSIADNSAMLVVPAADDPAVRYGVPLWSPDGRRIAFETGLMSADGGYGSRLGISVVDLDSGEVRPISTRPATTWSNLSWSPDGRHLAFVGQPDGVPIPTPDPEQERLPPEAAGDVFVIGADGTGERNITSSTAFEQGPAWSPDGTRLAYLSSDDGERYRLTTLPMDGAMPAGRPTLGPESEFAVWSPDATQLLWVGGGQSATGEGVSLIQVIDRDLVNPSTAIASVAGLILCAPSWASARH